MGHLTEYELKALSQEYLSRTKGKKISDASDQRLAEFLRTFKPEGVLEERFECEQESKQLYTQRGGANISPIVALPKGRLTQISNGAEITKSTPSIDCRAPTVPCEALPPGSANPAGTRERDAELIDFDEF